MPNLKLFKRRSSGNALEFASTDPPPGSSSTFRVLERPTPSNPTSAAAAANTTHNAAATGKRVNGAKTFPSPLQQLRGKSADDLGLGQNRGSAGTTNSGSSGYYDSSSASARHSSTSTLPSSIDQDREREADHEELFPRKAATAPMHRSAGARDDEPLPPPPSFKSRAGRAFSFGRHGRSGSEAQDAPPSTANGYGAGQSTSPTRDRSLTTSSYASTAKPPAPPPKTDQDFSLNMSSFGDDFGNMFSGIGRYSSRDELTMPSPSFHRPVSPGAGLRSDPVKLTRASQESEPMFPPRTLSRQAVTPSPNGIRSVRENGTSPYDLDERNSQEGLLGSSALSSPNIREEAPWPPAHGIAPAFLGRAKTGYSLVPERNPSPGIGRKSSESTTSYSSEVEEEEKHPSFGNRQRELNDGDRWMKRVELHDPPAKNSSFTRAVEQDLEDRSTLRAPAQATAGASRLGAISPASEESGSLFGGHDSSTTTTTPRAARVSMHMDSSPAGPPSRAIRPGGHNRTESGTPRKLTKAQFDALQRSGDNSQDQSEDEAHEDDDSEDEDEAERAKQAALQRRKQEANMAVYRQQMKKVTGGGPSDLPPAARPSMDRAAVSAPPATGMGLHLGGMGGTPPADAIRGKASEDEDEDVPLGVLQAHGFPGSGRPPTRQENDHQQRRMSVAGSVINGGAGQGNLPPFARRLPADPYFGASLVNGANRESLAFSSAQSVYGAPPSVAPQPMGHPGGLVGVIASEERAKASRRGSPNANGTYGQPLPANMPMPRTMSMGSMVAPQVYTPSGYMPGMPMMPQMPSMQDPNAGAQMQKMFEMQMQLMQNMLAMQQQQMTGTPQPQPPAMDYLGVRPTATMGTPGTPYGANGNAGRAMTMMNPPPAWDLTPGGSQSQRPISAMPAHYIPTGINAAGGPGPGYTPSIAPSERSNVGMPSRYRPVTMSGGNDAASVVGGGGAGGRSHSMTSSSMTLQALGNGQQAPRPESRQQQQQKSTIRVVDKAKGGPRISVMAKGNGNGMEEEEEDSGWAEMASKRKEKRFRWGKRDKSEQQQGLGDLVSGYE